MGQSNNYETYILSDLQTDDHLYQEAQLLCQEGVFDYSILEFVDYLKDYYIYVNSKSAVLSALSTISKRNQALVYFSGHGIDSRLLAPGTEREMIDGGVLLQALTQLADELFVVLDCCYPTTMDLPYRLDLR